MPKPFKPVNMHCPRHGAMRHAGEWVVITAPDDDETATVLHCAQCLWSAMSKLAVTAEPAKRRKRRQVRKQAVPVEKHTRAKPVAKKAHPASGLQRG